MRYEATLVLYLLLGASLPACTWAGAKLRSWDRQLYYIDKHIRDTCKALGGEEIYRQRITDQHVVYWCCDVAHEHCEPIDEFADNGVSV